MNAEEGVEAGEFEQRLRALLEDSTERLDGRIRSRLTRARYAALESRGSVARSAWRGWAPAGTLAASVLIALGLFANRGLTPPARAPQAPVVAAEMPAAPSVDDLELLADNDAIELPNADDYDFYEWAAAEAKSGGDKSGGEEIGS